MAAPSGRLALCGAAGQRLIRLYRRTASGTVTPSSMTLIRSVVITGCCGDQAAGTGTPGCLDLQML
jgi:hypothetical protein